MSFNNDKGYARCKACDRRFYPKWNKEHKEFESLCWQCLPIAIHTASVDPVLYALNAEGKPEFNPEAWTQASQDQAFIDGWLMDKIGAVGGDMWKEDEYLEYGEGAFGDVGLFDKYD